jgi:hypothetical protein
MKETCIQGWTKSMGQDEKTGERPICAAWQPVLIFNKETKNNEENYDCSAFGWTPDLLVELAQEVNQNAASTDKVANVMGGVRVAIQAALFTPPAPDPKLLEQGRAD